MINMQPARADFCVFHMAAEVLPGGKALGTAEGEVWGGALAL